MEYLIWKGSSREGAADRGGGGGERVLTKQRMYEGAICKLTIL